MFVYKENACRSAFAEAVALPNGIPSMSMSVHAIENAPANKQTIIVAKKMGYDLSGHRTTTIIYPILKKTVLLVAGAKWLPPPYIYDPFDLSNTYFENCFKSISKGGI